MRLTLSATFALFAASVPTGSGLAQDAASSLTIAARGEDARVAAVAHRLATAGLARCAQPVPALGIVLQHQTQFQLPDRPGMVAAYRLDRGPGVVAVVPGGPAARAGVRAGDVLLTLDATPVPPELHTDAPFDQTRARARADAVVTLLESRTAPFTATLLRDGAPLKVRITPVPACPSRVHLARSNQLNAFADGTHVFLTTRLLATATTDDELAFMIAHEMAHNVLGHAAAMRAAGVGRGIGRTLGRGGQILRQAERAADALAGELMLDAGYDPVAGAAVLRRFSDADLGITLFSAYESVDDRIAAMRTIAAARGR